MANFLLCSALCEDLVDDSHILGLILFIYSRIVYLSPPRLYNEFNIDRDKIQ